MPSLEDAYAMACRLIGDQAVQIALMAAQIQALEAARGQVEAATGTPERGGPGTS